MNKKWNRKIVIICILCFSVYNLVAQDSSKITNDVFGGQWIASNDLIFGVNYVNGENNIGIVPFAIYEFGKENEVRISRIDYTLKKVSKSVIVSEYQLVVIEGLIDSKILIIDNDNYLFYEIIPGVIMLIKGDSYRKGDFTFSSDKYDESISDDQIVSVQFQPNYNSSFYLIRKEYAENNCEMYRGINK